LEEREAEVQILVDEQEMIRKTSAVFNPVTNIQGLK
jgi:hypothetical protein